MTEFYHFLLTAILLLGAVTVLLFICVSVNAIFYTIKELIIYIFKKTTYIFKQFKQKKQ